MSARLQRLIRGEMFPNSALGRQAPLGWPEASVQSALIFLTQFLAEASSSKSLLSRAVCRHLQMPEARSFQEQEPLSADAAFQQICLGPSPRNSPSHF